MPDDQPAPTEWKRVKRWTGKPTPAPTKWYKKEEVTWTGEAPPPTPTAPTEWHRAEDVTWTGEAPTPTPEVEVRAERLEELRATYEEAPPEQRHERYREYRQFYETEYVPVYRRHAEVTEAEREREWERYAGELRRARVTEREITGMRESLRHLERIPGLTQKEMEARWEQYMKPWERIIAARAPPPMLKKPATLRAMETAFALREVGFKFPSAPSGIAAGAIFEEAGMWVAGAIKPEAVAEYAPPPSPLAILTVPEYRERFGVETAIGGAVIGYPFLGKAFAPVTRPVTAAVARPLMIGGKAVAKGWGRALIPRMGIGTAARVGPRARELLYKVRVRPTVPVIKGKILYEETPEKILARAYVGIKRVPVGKPFRVSPLELRSIKAWGLDIKAPERSYIAGRAVSRAQATLSQRAMAPWTRLTRLMPAVQRERVLGLARPLEVVTIRKGVGEQWRIASFLRGRGVFGGKIVRPKTTSMFLRRATGVPRAKLIDEYGYKTGLERELARLSAEEMVTKPAFELKPYPWVSIDKYFKRTTFGQYFGQVPRGAGVRVYAPTFKEVGRMWVGKTTPRKTMETLYHEFAHHIGITGEKEAERFAQREIAGKFYPTIGVQYPTETVALTPSKWPYELLATRARVDRRLWGLGRWRAKEEIFWAGVQPARMGGLPAPTIEEISRFAPIKGPILAPVGELPIFAPALGTVAAVGVLSAVRYEPITRQATRILQRPLIIPKPKPISRITPSVLPREAALPITTQAQRTFVTPIAEVSQRPLVGVTPLQIPTAAPSPAVVSLMPAVAQPKLLQKQRMRERVPRVQGYDVLLKRPMLKKGKTYFSRGYSKVPGGPHSRRSALGRGMGLVDVHSQASFKIQKSTSRKKPSRQYEDLFPTLRHKFRSPIKKGRKVPSNKYIEKTAFRIDSMGEVLEIPYRARAVRKSRPRKQKSKHARKKSFDLFPGLFKKRRRK